jgi:hypothetical protein
MRLEFQNPPGLGWDPTIPWTLYYPDGTRVTNNEPGVWGQRVYDRNNNYIETRHVTLPNGNPGRKIVDQLGRSITIEFDFALKHDYIRTIGVGGQEVTWTVKWKNAYVNKTYHTHSHFTQYPQTIHASWMVVDQIILPAQAGPLAYTFNSFSIILRPGRILLISRSTTALPLR